MQEAHGVAGWAEVPANSPQDPTENPTESRSGGFIGNNCICLFIVSECVDPKSFSLAN